MKKNLLFFLIFFSNFSFASENLKKDITKIFKNEVCGYTLEYPVNWYLDAPPDGETDLDVPVKISRGIYFYIKNSTEHCKSTDDCKMYLSCYGGTADEYAHSLKFINDFVKHEKVLNPSKTRIVEFEFNGQKSEIVVREYQNSSYEAYVYIYCEKNRHFFGFSSGRKFNDTYQNFSDLEKKPISLETIFNEQQQQIIKSFKCPAADFIYKEPEKPRKKTKK